MFQGGLIGPGPGKYMLPPNVGYKDHNVAKYRNPQYSIGPKVFLTSKQLSPGPKYDTSHFTRYGKDSPPAYSIAGKIRPLSSFQTPGPDRYYMEKVPRMKEKRPPVYSMSFKTNPITGFQTPGPNKYDLPSSLGPKIVDKKASPAYSLAVKHFLASKEQSPGPARYDPPNVDLIKYRNPQYTMQARNMGVASKNVTPAANKYMVRAPKSCSGGYTFGMRTGKIPYITPDDQMPCINE